MNTRTEMQFAEPLPSARVSKSGNGMRDMTTGSVRMHIVRMSLFLLAGMVVQTLYSLADVYWVARLGQQAVAAVSLAANWNFVSLACTQILSVGTVALVSQAAGRRQGDEVRRGRRAARVGARADDALAVLGEPHGRSPSHAARDPRLPRHLLGVTRRATAGAR